jgi:hypothetical protein
MELGSASTFPFVSVLGSSHMLSLSLHVLGLRRAFSSVRFVLLLV